MPSIQQYRGMSVREIGEYATLVFACNALMSSRVTEAKGMSDVVATFRELFADTFPEAPVILGMTEDLMRDELMTDELPDEFVSALENLAQEITTAISMTEGMRKGQMDDPMEPRYPAVGIAFADACRSFPEDLDMEDSDYDWDTDEEDSVEDPLMDAAEEAETTAMAELLEEDQGLGAEIMGEFEQTGSFANEDDEELWGRVVKCLDQFYSEMEVRPDILLPEPEFVKQGLQDMDPEFVEYFLDQMALAGAGSKIVMFPGAEDARTRMIRLLEENFLDTFMKSILDEGRLFSMQELCRKDPRMRHMMFFGVIGTLSEEGFFDMLDDPDWDEEDDCEYGDEEDEDEEEDEDDSDDSDDE
ncbi:MAG: hypothetical protein ACI4OJ_11280 [Lachnospiraceae bacterium]